MKFLYKSKSKKERYYKENDRSSIKFVGYNKNFMYVRHGFMAGFTGAYALNNDIGGANQGFRRYNTYCII